VQTHLAFLSAGADVVSTSSYQASALAFRLAGISADKAEQLLVKSVQLAQQAREQYLALDSTRERYRPLLLLSLGPYGAALSNGSECEYRVSDNLMLE
jgi:homocysteine S-methyltransferase